MESGRLLMRPTSARYMHKKELEHYAKTFGAYLHAQTPCTALAE